MLENLWLRFQLKDSGASARLKSELRDAANAVYDEQITSTVARWTHKEKCLKHDGE